ncbi:hypothetical protein DDZ18_07965 [Marinicauda salina]|jgi:hypothetical protein|uniref:Uncharacterized protein n=1 Tax=Marinicauda salina TaxID=2135793 RepID=A0A2U2BUB8_9PROT|nr:hypothetical protein [Marinicauda salina]PWE17592.1 hypothetical protein DDZ18_07965 [Marinicauda salina]
MLDGVLRPEWMLFAVSGVVFIALTAAATTFGWLLPFPASLVWAVFAAGTAAGLAWIYARRIGRGEAMTDD